MRLKMGMEDRLFLVASGTELWGKSGLLCRPVMSRKGPHLHAAPTLDTRAENKVIFFHKLEGSNLVVSLCRPTTVADGALLQPIPIYLRISTLEKQS